MLHRWSEPAWKLDDSGSGFWAGGLKKMTDNSEELREALLNLEQARIKEARQGQISEGLLEGLRTLVLSRNSEELFHKLFDVMRRVLNYDNAFVLSLEKNGRFVSEAESASQFAKRRWDPKSLFNRVISGQPVAVFDVEQVEEWKQQPKAVRRHVRSALHFPISTPMQAALFICTHSQLGFFSSDHLELSRRFSILAEQTLQKIESETQLAILKQKLKDEEKLAALNRKLRVSEKRFSAAFRFSPSAIVISSLKSGKCLDVNEHFEQLTGYSQQESERLDSISRSLFAHSKEWERFNRVLENHQRVSNFEFKVRCKNGGEKTGLASAEVIHLDDDVCQLLTISDITIRKTAEEKIKASLDEKTVMLKELHHRVKNNMQIISSLLNLQSREIKDPKVIEMLQEGRNRIHSMALIHEKLYRSKDFSCIDFMDYVKNLSAQLFRSYKIDAHAVKTNVAVDPIPIDINTAVPLGMVINELVSNSLKHAFQDGSKGLISISLTQEKKNRKIILTVEDDGVGMPEHINTQQAGSFGLELINTLVRQLDGTISWSGEKGTCVRIAFDLIS